MFRKPRELPNAGESPPKPSTGRPPTPPSATNSRIPLVIEENTRIAQDLTVLLSAQNKMMSKSNGRTISFAVGKARAKPNGSILSFFKKTASSSTAEPTFKTSEESLFLDNENLEEQEVVQIPTPPRDFSTTDISPKDGNGRETESDSFRFNEENGPMKRRRMDEVMVSSPLSPSRELAGRLRIGPFIEDSDNEEETLHTFPEEIFEEDSKVNHSSSESPKEIFFSEDTIKPFGTLDSPRVPRLKRESTNTIEEHDFQGLDDFIDDEFPEEGEEYLERKWMEEQTQFELSLEEDTPCETPLEKSESIINTESIESLSNSAATVCPICSMELMGRTDQVS